MGLRSRLFAVGSARAGRRGRWRWSGALFAVSFDALAIATLFAASASGRRWVWWGSALSFASGMLLVGAANGFWVVRLLRHSGHASRVAARVMTLTIGVVALLVSVRACCSAVLRAHGPLDGGLRARRERRASSLWCWPATSPRCSWRVGVRTEPGRPARPRD